MNIDIILVEPSIVENIGFIARSIEVYSITNHLVLVNPPQNYKTTALITAAGCETQLLESRVVRNFDDIIPEYNTLIGTTRRKGGLRYPLYTPHQAAQFLATDFTNEKIGLVFGRENKGLYNEELDKCRMISTIPCASETFSLNLSHAVTIYLDALFQAKHTAQPRQKGTGIQPADEQEVDQLVTHAIQLLEKSKFIKYGDKSLQRTLQHLLQKPIIEKKDITLLQAICYHFEKLYDN